MALVYRSTILTPPKFELVAQWLPSQPWSGGHDGSAVEQIGSYRFDDPAGKVGVDTMVLRTADGRLLQVPATYREAPLEGAEDALIGTSDHSVLGMRWIYDGTADPVWVAAMIGTIINGGTEAELDVALKDGSHEIRKAGINVVGSGSDDAESPVVPVTAFSDATTTTVHSGDRLLVIRRHLDQPFKVSGRYSLTGAWPGLDEPTVLAAIL